MCKQRIQHFQKDHVSDFLKNSGLMRYLNCQILYLLWGKTPISNMLNYTEDWAVHIKPDLPQTVSDLHKAHIRDCLPFVKRLQFSSRFLQQKNPICVRWNTMKNIIYMVENFLTAEKNIYQILYIIIYILQIFMLHGCMSFQQLLFLGKTD